jgi:hypothetical protein
MSVSFKGDVITVLAEFKSSKVVAVIAVVVIVVVIVVVVGSCNKLKK